MYTKCGALSKAQDVLCELTIRDVVSWNALVAGYAQLGQCKDIADCFVRMQSEGLSPDAITHACTLKACGITKEYDLGKAIHHEVVSQGTLGKHIALGNALVDMYAKCGVLKEAHHVFDDLPARNVVTWSVLIAGYIQEGHFKEAVHLYEKMRHEGLSPNAITYTCILKACGITKDIDTGERIHDEIVCQGLLGKDVVLGNALVNMYAKGNALTRAQAVLDELSVRDVISWNALIVGYSQQGQCEEAIDCFNRMRKEGLYPDAISYACILKVCAIIRDCEKGKQIHDEMISRRVLGKNFVLGTALVDMYAKCGELMKAQQVLDELPIQNVVSWNALIAGYCQQGQGKEAIESYKRMQHQGIPPDEITYACVLKACGIMKYVDIGKEVHDTIASKKLLEGNAGLGNALIDMYTKCGVLKEARRALLELPVRSVVSWSTLIAGYAQNKQGKEALDCFEHMRSEGLFPDAITYVCALKACGSTREIERGKQIHDEIVYQGILDKNIVLGNALVDMYAKCSLLAKARKVLDELPVREVVSWNALISGYVQHGQGKEAINCFYEMEYDSLSPDAITYACILRAIGMTQQVFKGKETHDEIVSQGLLEKNVMLGNALVDMYVKCGVLTKAQDALEKLPARNVVAWSALIAGYAQHGQVKEAMDCFDLMEQDGLTPNLVSWNALIGAHAQQGLGEETLCCFKNMKCKGISPDAITFVYLLNACSHSGLVYEGQMFYFILNKNFDVTPYIEIHVCMIDLFGRSGRLDKAMGVVQGMPSFDYTSVWTALFAACRRWGHMKLGRLAFEHAIELDRCDATAYVGMEMMYAASSMQEER